MIAWAQVANVIVRAAEYDILRSMDRVFCEETNKELQAYHERLTKKPVPGGDKPGD